MNRSWLPILFLLLTAFVLGCSSYEPPRVQNGRQPRDAGLRPDCNAIMGTVFHSSDERVWFETNCSRWPAVSGMPQTSQSGQPARGGSAVSQAEPPECIAQRGKPYSSDAQRQWFLANCLGQPAVAGPQIRPEITSLAPAEPSGDAGRVTPPPLPPAPQPLPAGANPIPPSVIPTPTQVVVVAPTRVPNQAPAPVSNMSCDAIRRNANPTDAERRWYFMYCNY